MPEHFGRYEIKSELGRGGMATVYHAYDPRFERDVAIKVLPHEFLHDTQFRARFEREAKTIALIEHPAIVPVYDFGEEDGQPYIVMRYMSGGSLAERLQKGPLNIPDAQQILTRLAPALDAAHAKGIIHRDLKPGNVLFDQYGNAFLSDFGIARLTQSGSGTLTGGAILGTPSYMSPEQIQGDRELDGRSDIYALGIILFQMLTGSLPYKSDTPAKVMMMHLLEPVPQILNFKDDLPPALEGVIDQALAKEPDQRYSSAAELTKAVETVLKEEGEPTAVSKSKEKTVLGRAAGKGGAAATVMGGRRGGKPGSASAATVIGAAPAVTAPRKGFPVWLFIIGGLLLLGLVVGGAVGGYALLSGKLAFQPTPTWTLAPSASPTTEIIAQAPTATFTLTAAPSDTPLPSTTATQTPTATNAPSATLTPIPTVTPTPTPQPTDTLTPAPQAPIIGGADKVAWVSGNNIYIANLDGTELKQLTTDSGAKKGLNFSPDGKAIFYIVGKCINYVEVDTGRVQGVSCYNNAASVDAFEISYDGAQVALSVNSEPFIVPFDLDRLKTIQSKSGLQSLATCAAFAPIPNYIISTIHWARDGQKIAAIFKAASPTGQRLDEIVVLDVSHCSWGAQRVIDFPAEWFDISGYNNNPIIQTFGWDGLDLFVLNGYVRNDGFGDLYVFNMNLHQAQLKLNPINNSCCYRDPSWSPDGSHLLVAYQDYNTSGPTAVIKLYLIQFGTINSGVQYEPLNIPLITNPREKPMAILRPAQQP
jgi:serine/threonine-protein kinase